VQECFWESPSPSGHEEVSNRFEKLRTNGFLGRARSKEKEPFPQRGNVHINLLLIK
jgi:hypothetical protein